MSQEEYCGKTVEFPEDHLRKTFDEQGRIVEIEFLLSGKKCQIEYTGDCWGSKDIQHVTWSDGYTYITEKLVDENLPDRPVVGWRLVEKENPNHEYVTTMNFDAHNKMVYIAYSIHMKTIFKREIGDFGFDGRIRVNERDAYCLRKLGE